MLEAAPGSRRRFSFFLVMSFELGVLSWELAQFLAISVNQPMSKRKAELSSKSVVKKD